VITARLLAFGDALRKNGVRAAEQEVLDAFRALSVVDDAFVERERLLAILAATLAKSPAEEDTLARLFALHFDVPIDEAATISIADLLRQRGLDADEIDQVLENVDDELLQALLAGDAGRVAELVRAALEESDLEGLQSQLQIAYFTSRVMQRLGAQGLEERMMLARGRGGGGDVVNAAQWEVSERLRRAVRRAVEQELDKRTLTKPTRDKALLERDLRAVDASEVAELRRLVRRLAEKLRERLVVRRRRARRGRVDVRRMLRRSVATDAIPMRIELAKKKREKPEVIVLCDVSDSVRQASLFMLELTAAIGDVLKRVRSFVFVDRVAEVSALFEDVDAAIAGILAGDVMAVGANSDYGKALRAFYDEVGPSLTRKTTVVILGDGRSNYRPAEEWILGEMKRRSRRLLWLCPEDRPTWGYGDSEMTRYARHADAIFVVRSASDLARAIDRIAR
jgi:uncharacterized protein with von Willebrand factor type A (vWA) domain